MAKEISKCVPNYGNERDVKMLNMPQVLANMQLGKRGITKEICYRSKIASMNSTKLFISENGVQQMQKVKPLFNLKQSVVPETCEIVTSILPIDNENILVGTGSSDNDLHMVNMKKVVEANYEFKNSCAKPKGKRLSTPKTEKSVMKLTKLLPRTAQVQWGGGVQGLSTNKDGTLIACSSRNGKDLTILGLDRNKKWSYECKDMNEALSKEEIPVYNWAEIIIRGWHKNPTLPNSFEVEDKFGIFTRGGFLNRFAHGQGHTRNIVDTCWIGNKQVVSVGDDGCIILWDVDEEKPAEEREQWPTQILSVVERGITKLSGRIHQRKVFSEPNALTDRAKLVGIDMIGGTGKVLTSTTRGKIYVMNGINANNSDVWEFPGKYLPISFLPETRVVVDQDVHQATGEVIVSTP